MDVAEYNIYFIKKSKNAIVLHKHFIIITEHA